MTSAARNFAVTVPALGEAVTEATISRWLKSVGDTVEFDEPLLELSTDKVDTEILAPTAGMLADILEPEDAVVLVGATIARIVAIESAPTPTPGAPPHADVDHPVLAVDESAHRIDRADRVEKLPRIRRTIARRMRESLNTSAQLTTFIEVDLTSVAALRAEEKQAFVDRTGVKLSFLPFVVVAAVEALAEHPVINASLNTDCTEVTYHGAVHLGIAVDSERGLMVPVIRDAQKRGIVEISRAIADSADAVRRGTISPDDFSGGTFTITNTGSRGALFDTPIINQPQSAILGVGAVVERVVPQYDNDRNLQIGVRSMAYLALSYDHRLVDGADAARYLSTVRARLQTGFAAAELV